MGTSDRISIVNDAWISGSSTYLLSNLVTNHNVMFVANLINSNRECDKDLVTLSFAALNAKRILWIP